MRLRFYGSPYSRWPRQQEVTRNHRKVAIAISDSFAATPGPIPAPAHYMIHATEHSEFASQG